MILVIWLKKLTLTCKKASAEVTEMLYTFFTTNLFWGTHRCLYFRKKNRQHPHSRMNKQNKTNLKAWGEFFSVRGSASTRYSIANSFFLSSRSEEKPSTQKNLNQRHWAPRTRYQFNSYPQSSFCISDICKPYLKCARLSTPGEISQRYVTHLDFVTKNKYQPVRGIEPLSQQ